MRSKGFSASFPVVLAFLAASVVTVSSAQGQATETILHVFGGPGDGGMPWASLIFDKAGNLYGTASAGTVFELTPTASGWQETILYTFTGGLDGGTPYGALTFDAAGNLYGTTFGGGRKDPHFCGPQGCGTVFELSPSAGGGWTETVLHHFTGGKDGEGPLGTLVFDAAGNLYGTTASGGNTSMDSVGGGVVFELSPSASGWKEKVLHSFTGGSDGRTLYDGVIFDSAGNLYGTTQWGGNLADCSGFGCGTVFKLSPSPDGKWKGSLVHAFTEGNDGANPWGGLVIDAAGNLYGTTQFGGAKLGGTVFEFSPTSTGWKGKLIYAFAGGTSDGSLPQGTLALDAKGNLYGTTYRGGSTQTWGTVFELSPSPNGVWSETVLHSFGTALVDGENPIAGVILDSAGNLYGTTPGGSQSGVVYEITP